MFDLLNALIDAIVPTIVVVAGGGFLYVLHYALIPYSTRRGLRTAKEAASGFMEGFKEEAKAELRSVAQEAVKGLWDQPIEAEQEDGTKISVPFLEYVESRVDGFGAGLMDAVRAEIAQLKQEALPMVRESIQLIASAAASGRATSNSKLGVQARAEKSAMRDLVRSAIVQGAAAKHPLMGLAAGTIMDNVPEVADMVLKHPDEAQALYGMLGGSNGGVSASQSPPPSFSQGGTPTKFENGQWK